jgi:hypothetical protein
MSTLFDEVASPEVQGDDQKESGFGGAERKRLIILGAVGGVLVLGAGGYFLLGSGSGDDSVATGPVVTHHATPKTSATSPPAAPKASASPTSVPTIQSALQTGRDPFAPLVVAPVATSSPSATSTPGATGDAAGAGSSTTDSTTGTTGATDGASASSSPSTSTKPASGKFTLNKLAYDQNNVWYADVTWNGKEYTPILGSTFADTFTFVAEANGYASFNNGGQSFRLAVGFSKQF